MSYIIVEGGLLLDVVKWEHCESVFAVENFMDDFYRNVLGKNTRGDKRYVRWLQRVVNDLEIYGTEAMELAPRFEWLKNADGICSARYSRSKKNPRILFFFFSQGHIVLLYPFLEKSEKDYERALEIAKQRKKAVVF